MEPIYLSIQPVETGKRIKQLLSEQNYTIREIQVRSALKTHRQSISGSPENRCRAWTTLSFSADYYIPVLKISSSLTGIFLVYGSV